MFIKRGSPNRSRRAPFGATAFSLALHLKKRCSAGKAHHCSYTSRRSQNIGAHPGRRPRSGRAPIQAQKRSFPPLPPGTTAGPTPQQGGCGPVYLCTSTGGVCQAFARTALFLAPPSSLSRRLLPGRQCEGQLLYRPMAGCPFP
jgi:hypothetical protein